MLFVYTIYKCEQFSSDDLGITLEKLDISIMINANLTKLLSLLSVRIRKNFRMMKLKVGLVIEG